MKLLSISRLDPGQAKFRQIAIGLREAITKGRIQAGEILPSTRILAEELQVNRHTVRAAYEELLTEGWVTARERLGYFVAEDLPLFPPPPPSQLVGKLSILQQRILHDGNLDRAERALDLARFPFNLQSSVPDLRLLPVDELRACFTRALRQLPSHLDYQGVLGEPTLHASLKEVIRQQRQLLDRELMLTHGSQEAIYITASLLIKPDTIVGVEAKGYQPAWRCFQHFGAKLAYLPLDQEGLQVQPLEALLQQGNVSMLYLTPLHQFPSTVTLSPARRARIMNLLKTYKVPLLEDDYDHDVHYDSFPPLPMAAQDPEQLVVYISTLSKLIFPGTRIGFLAVPKAVLPAFLAIKAQTSRVNETFASRAIGLWVQEGGLERHLRRLRRVYKQRRDHLIDRLQASRFFRERVRFSVPQGGMNLWLELDRHPEELCRQAAEKGLLLSGEHLYLPSDRLTEARHLRLGFAALQEVEMDRALKTLQNCL